MLKVFKFNKKNSSKSLELFLNKRKSIQKNKIKAVNKIIRDVIKNGDKAVLNYEKKFSKIKTKSTSISFSKNEINKISRSADNGIKKAINIAFKRIKKFHSKQKFSSFNIKDEYKNLDITDAEFEDLENENEKNT